MSLQFKPDFGDFLEIRVINQRSVDNQVSNLICGPPMRDFQFRRSSVITIIKLTQRHIKILQIIHSLDITGEFFEFRKTRPEILGKPVIISLEKHDHFPVLIGVIGVGIEDIDLVPKFRV